MSPYGQGQGLTSLPRTNKFGVVTHMGF